MIEAKNVVRTIVVYIHTYIHTHACINICLTHSLNDLWSISIRMQLMSAKGKAVHKYMYVHNIHHVHASIHVYLFTLNRLISICHIWEEGVDSMYGCASDRRNSLLSSSLQSLATWRPSRCCWMAGPISTPETAGWDVDVKPNGCDWIH